MLDKLKSISERLDAVNEKLMDPEVITDQDQYKKYMKEHKNLSPIVDKYHEFLTVKGNVDEARELMDENLEPDFREIVEEEYKTGKERLEVLEEEIKILLLPRDPNDDKNVIVEIRGGAGGEESALFANSLYRMYSMYAEKKGYKVEVLSINETELGGIKEISFSIEGEGAYSRLKFESGVHRVQRVPETESQGRIHTSTVTVAVLPEAEEVEVDINPADLIIETHRSGGAGGQHVNKTESAIRIIHVPTNTIVDCQDERSQHKNKEKAMKILRSRIFENMLAEQNEKIASDRRLQVGSGDRSERIRTYNFPQGRVTDHRIGLTLYKILQIMDGDLDELIDTLITTDQADKLKAGGEEQ
ncbi:MAG: peptide chain release factor 1 [Clostridia bacterium]|nr:peptide chain release factor 1 [Clostridia bacterium]MBQ4628700.1 peptide chain release factor 1 [Clostridia bacterium]